MNELINDPFPSHQFNEMLQFNDLNAQNFEFLLLFISMGNALKTFFFSFKDYPLFQLETEAKFPKSEFSENYDIEKKSRSARLEMFQISDHEFKLVWILKIWAPSNGNLQLLSWFSPIQTILVYLSPHDPSLLMLAYFSSLIIHALVDHYIQSLQDQRLLAHELVAEALKNNTIVWSKAANT